MCSVDSTLIVLAKSPPVSWLLSLDVFSFKKGKNYLHEYVLPNIKSVLAAFIFIAEYFHSSILSTIIELCTIKCPLEELNHTATQ